MYEKLAKELRELSHEFYLDDNNKYAEEKLKEAADAIEELICEVADEHNARLDAENRQRWIPVSERKPKTDDIVIVAIHDDSGDTPYDVTNVGFYLDVFPLGIWVVENERYNYVTHWMPLPKGPEEE